MIGGAAAFPFSATARPGVAAFGLQMLTGAERLLWEASDRALRQPQNYLALVLHLSRLKPPAPRSYHIRIARVLIQDCAARFGGQVFAMRNRDLVLLCRSGGTQPGKSDLPVNADRLDQTQHDDLSATPNALPSMLGRLFSADPDPATLTSLWCLDRDATSLFGYLAERASAQDAIETLDDQDDAVLSVAALQGILAKAPLGELLSQQTGMTLDSDRSRSVADRLVPAFREFEVSLAALNLGALVSRATADPYLLGHLKSGFEARVMEVLANDLATGGALTRSCVQTRLPVHLKLGPHTILSPGFARLSRRAASMGIRLGASVSLMQACADLDLMEHARRALVLTGAELILTHVDPLALAMVKPASLQPGLIKIVWSPALLTSLSGRQEIKRDEMLFQRFCMNRTVLQNADSHLAIAWGQAHGITLFQGPFLDQIQAATRMAHCHAASGCTVRQCGARAGAVSIAGRTGCINQELLADGFRAREEVAVLCS